MVRKTRYEVTFGPRDVSSFLDMLRYDGSRVVDWRFAIEGQRWTVTLESDGMTTPALDRWASFGLRAATVR